MSRARAEIDVAIEREESARVVLDAAALVRRRAWYVRASQRLAWAMLLGVAICAMAAVASRLFGSVAWLDVTVVWTFATTGASVALAVGLAAALRARVGWAEAVQVLDGLVGGRQECVAAVELLRRGDSSALTGYVSQSAAARIAAAPRARFDVRHPLELWGMSVLLAIATFAILELPIRDIGPEDGRVPGAEKVAASRASSDARAVETPTDDAPDSRDPSARSSGSSGGDDVSNRESEDGNDPAERGRESFDSGAAESGDEAARGWARALGRDSLTSEDVARVRRARAAASAAGASEREETGTARREPVGTDASRASNGVVDPGYPARYREVVARYFDPSR